MSKLAEFLTEGTTFSIKSEKGDRSVSFTDSGEILDETGEFEKWMDVSTEDLNGVFIRGAKEMVVIRWDLKKRFEGVSQSGSGIELYLNRAEEELFDKYFRETRNWEAISVDSPAPEVKSEATEEATIGILSSFEINVDGTVLFKRSSLSELDSIQFAFDHSESIEVVISSELPNEVEAIIERKEHLKDVEVIAFRSSESRISSFAISRSFLEVNKNRFIRKTKEMNFQAALKQVCNERNTKTLVLSTNRGQDA